MPSTTHAAPAFALLEERLQQIEENGAPPGNHGHPMSEVTGLQAALDGKQPAGNYADASHSHDSAYAAANHNHDAAYAAANHTHAGLGLGGSAALPATTGTMTANMAAARVLTITPTGACTFNASGGTVGHEVTFAITTSGTTSFVLTWGTGFRKAGTLATGTTSGRFFSVTFVCVAANTWQEIGRTAVLS